MQHIKHLILSILVFNMLSCGFLEDKTKDNEAMAVTVQDTTAQNAPTDGYIVTPHVAHPKFKALSAAFEKQEHRFEIDRCEFKYNGESFFIGDTKEKIIEVFGKPDEAPIFTFDEEVYSLVYDKLKITLRFIAELNTLRSITIRMSNYKGHEDTPYKIIKFRKTPYHLDMNLNEFIELTDLEHGETLGHSLHSFSIINEIQCDNKFEINTSIGSTPIYHSIGGGHVTMRGEFNPNSTGPINILGVGLKTNS